jgi:hypothetical protein
MSDNNVSVDLGAQVDINTSEKNENIEQRDINIDTNGCDVETTVKEDWFSKETTETIDCPEPEVEVPEPPESEFQELDKPSETQSVDEFLAEDEGTNVEEFLAEDSQAETQTSYESSSESELGG